MKLKTNMPLVLISCILLALGGCSAKKRNADCCYYNNTPSVTELDGGGAKASGIGESEGFGSGGMSSGSSKKLTYYFDYDSNVVHDSDKPAIFVVANNLVAHPNKKIILQGHTDPRGSREYNVALGERRANAVAELLKSRGVSPSQIRIVSYGAERLAVPGYTESAYQLDRRAMIVYQR